LHLTGAAGNATATLMTLMFNPGDKAMINRIDAVMQKPAWELSGYD
jgi:hypothetical protein